MLCGFLENFLYNSFYADLQKYHDLKPREDASKCELWLNCIIQDQCKWYWLRKTWEDKIWMKHMEIMYQMVSF